MSQKANRLGVAKRRDVMRPGAAAAVLARGESTFGGDVSSRRKPVPTVSAPPFVGVVFVSMNSSLSPAGVSRHRPRRGILRHGPGYPSKLCFAWLGGQRRDDGERARAAPHLERDLATGLVGDDRGNEPEIRVRHGDTRFKLRKLAPERVDRHGEPDTGVETGMGFQS
jgi:hypothetical protein